MFPRRRHPQEGDVPKKMSPRRRHPQEGDVPKKETSPGRRCPQEDVPKKETSPGRRCPQEGDVPRKEMSPRRCPQEGDIPRKEKGTSPGRRCPQPPLPPQAAQSQGDPHPSLGPACSWGHTNWCQPRELAVVTAMGTQPPLGSTVAAREGAGDTELAGSGVCHHPALINVVRSSP
ncbi:PREDICTED: basic salivary proline-rich protein 3-like [Pterocles gutturalis]|uniref:basic salivary proline-rich protein 3-like n=1 Tax=Pterocles gutturalis TaxID=240206 RepID=UPI00052874E5|nr:PREDICTED: basic salivary proline-rich protein 3-like [Pterocles gutturalis]